MLFPFFPLNPHRLAEASSSSASTALPAELRLSFSHRGEGGGLLEPPPRIADTDDCAQRACLRIAEVTVMHSVTTRATGSTATDMGLDCLRVDGTLSSFIVCAGGYRQKFDGDCNA